MSRNAMNFISRLFHSSKIKNFETKIIDIYSEDYKNKSFKEESIDCLKLQNDNINLINAASGSEKLKYLVGLQALYNVKSKELDFVEKLISSTPISEYKSEFSSEYNQILINVKSNEVIPMDEYIEHGKFANSKDVQKNNLWGHVLSCLAICAIDEVFGEQLNKIESNIRGV